MEDWTGKGGRKDEEENSKAANDVAFGLLLPTSSPLSFSFCVPLELGPLTLPLHHRPPIPIPTRDSQAVVVVMEIHSAALKFEPGALVSSSATMQENTRAAAGYHMRCRARVVYL